MLQLHPGEQMRLRDPFTRYRLENIKEKLFIHHHHPMLNLVLQCVSKRKGLDLEPIAWMPA